jgi:L-methionine (R)-S-oxide reductase
MRALTPVQSASKPNFYRDLQAQLAALLEGERNWVANCANTAAALYRALADLNWAGFYMMTRGELVLGPFQGKVACVRIEVGRGVCGTAASRRETIVVPDVHEFPGHIACDPDSRSEIVVPMLDSRGLLGVLDLDSPQTSRFDQDDRQGLEALVRLLVNSSDWSG